MSLAVGRHQHALESLTSTEALAENEQGAIAFWRQLFRLPPPRQGRRDLLIRFLAHGMHEKAYDEPSQATRKRLSELARKFETNPNAELSGAILRVLSQQRAVH